MENYRHELGLNKDDINNENTIWSRALSVVTSATGINENNSDYGHENEQQDDDHNWEGHIEHHDSDEHHNLSE